MTAPVRLAAFAVVLAAVLGAGFGVGRAVGPLDAPAEPVHSTQHDSTTQPGTTTQHEGGHP